MAARTVKVSNVSLGASEQDIKEFFSFSGDIEYVEMKSGDEKSQIAYVTFRNTQGADTATLLSGATIVDMVVAITPAPEYELPPSASVAHMMDQESRSKGNPDSALRKAEDVVSSMLAKGLVLGIDAVTKAKAFDEKHQITSTAASKVASLDQKIGLSDKITTGAAIVNEKVKEMNQKYQVSEKTKQAFATTEQKVSDAGNAILENKYVLDGAAWVTGAFRRAAKAAADLGAKTKETAASEPVYETAPATKNVADQNKKPPPAEGLIL